MEPEPVMGDTKEAVMADEPANDPTKTDPAKPDPKTEEDVKRLQKALDDERKARRDADAKVKDLETKVGTLEGEGKSENEKLTGQLDKLTKDLDSERVMRLKAEVAADKGLSKAQAKRLTGTTLEEMEADADDLLEAFPTKSTSSDEGAGGGGNSGPPSRQPRPALRGGTDPTKDDETVDPAKLADAIPRP